MSGYSINHLHLGGVGSRESMVIRRSAQSFLNDFWDIERFGCAAEDFIEKMGDVPTNRTVESLVIGIASIGFCSHLSDFIKASFQKRANDN
jgi:hypothetical protein